MQLLNHAACSGTSSGELSEGVQAMRSSPIATPWRPRKVPDVADVSPVPQG